MIDATVKKKKRGWRGWLLIEVTIGGVMASVVLGALLVNVGDSMDKSAVVGRKLTAQMLAKQGIEQIRARTNPVLTVADNAEQDIGVPSGLRGTYVRKREITSNTETINGLSVRFKEITVTVTFPQRTATKTVVMKSRLYTGS